DGDCLHVSVHDEDPTLPRPREPQTGATSGRGMGIVGALADDWSMKCQRHGKTVTACFRPTAAQRKTVDPVHTPNGTVESVGARRSDASLSDRSGRPRTTRRRMEHPRRRLWTRASSALTAFTLRASA
ncbi:ATP-binding protein, partial [Streptomyces sp. NPDC006333]|uniref:ATP-binding protein n=1 Tax=Streptomyces sp. NPDC006333 TaxID=3156753 RepID=UPI0033BBEA52